MRNLNPVSAGLVVFMAVVAGVLWFELRGNRQQLAEMRSELDDLKAHIPGSVQTGPALAAVPQLVTETKPVPEDSSRAAAPLPASPPAAPLPVIQIVPGNLNPVPRSEESLHSEAMAQSDSTATARVLGWRDRLAVAGLTLTTEQLQALDAAMRRELRVETEETLEISKTTVPLDARAAAAMREETINRQNATNLRVLDAAAPQLTSAQVLALRTQFEQGHAARLASVRRELEQITNSGN
jgi:hypothetical protein